MRDGRCGRFCGNGLFGGAVTLDMGAWVRLELCAGGNEDLTPAGVGGEAGCADAGRGCEAVDWYHVGLSGYQGLTAACVSG